MKTLLISLLLIFSQNLPSINNEALIGEWKVTEVNIDYKPDDENIKNNYAKKAALERYIEEELLQKKYSIQIDKGQCIFLEKGKVISTALISKIEDGQIIDDKGVTVFTYQLAEDNQTCEFVAVDGTVFHTEKVKE